MLSESGMAGPGDKAESHCERPSCPHALVSFLVNLYSKLPNFLVKTHQSLPGMPPVSTSKDTVIIIDVFPKSTQVLQGNR